MKIFEIGVSKTGTTSLGRAYEILGFRHKGVSKIITKKFYKSEPYDYNILFEVIDRYGAFQDSPWHNCDYKILDKRYPGSKFILLERDDESWIRSLEYWSSPILNEDWETWLDEYDKNTIDKRWKTDRDNLIKEKLDWKHLKYRGIKEYFKNRQNDLLVMNICDGEGWEKLCSFLNKPVPDVPFPKENVTENYNIIS